MTRSANDSFCIENKLVCEARLGKAADIIVEERPFRAA